MNDRFHFADLCTQYVGQSGYTLGQLARLSGLPKPTIANWIEGRVRKPRSWQGLVKIAKALHLSESDASQLLQAAGHPSIEQLLAAARTSQKKADLDLLHPWAETVRKRFAEVPFQAIADLHHFVGREQERSKLKKILLSGRHVTLYTLEGMAGAGKTALATRLAHELRLHFPDGVLWARLDTSNTMSILSAFADAFGRDVSKYTDIGSRSQVVRNLFANKRALIVLDNAQNSKQLSPLLPPSGHCAVLITTRHRYLSATRGAHRFAVRPFNEAKGEAFELFAALLGPEEALAKRDALNEIADLLGHLPLAVDIAASRMANEPNWTANAFLKRLRQEKRRLKELAYEDESVRMSFNLSHEALSPELKHFFAALGVFGGEGFTVEAVAYVTQLPLEDTEDNLRQLYGLSLVQLGRQERYRLHTLLADYAREKMTNDESVERMVHFFVNFVKAHEKENDVLELDLHNILTALEFAFERRMQSALVQGIHAFNRFLQVRGLYDLAETHLKRAEQVTRTSEDTPALATTLLNLGYVAGTWADYAQAERYFQEGLALAKKMGDHKRICDLLSGLGGVAQNRGGYEQAEAYYQKALGLAREMADDERISALFQHLGVLADNFGHYAQAEEYLLQALQLATETQNRERKSLLLANLGMVAHRHQNYEQAEEYLLEGLTLARQVGFRASIISLLSNLGLVTMRRSKFQEAKAYFLEGLTLARQIEERERVITLLANLGRVTGKCGDYVQAEEYLLEALSLAREIGQLPRISYILDILSWLISEQGENLRAETYMLEGLSVAREIGHRRRTRSFLWRLGDATSQRGAYNEAEVYYQEALSIAQELADHLRTSRILIGYGKLHLKQQHWNLAAICFRQALELAQKLDIEPIIVGAQHGLQQVALAEGDMAHYAPPSM